MKVECERIKVEKFDPIKLTFTIDNAKDATALYCLFKHSVNCDFLTNESFINHTEIREAISSNCDISNYENTFEVLNKAIKER